MSLFIFYNVLSKQFMLAFIIFLEKNKMPINIECPSCNKLYTFKNNLSGKKVKCICGNIFVICEKNVSKEHSTETVKQVEDNPINNKEQNKKLIFAFIALGVLFVICISFIINTIAKSQVHNKTISDSETSKGIVFQNPKMGDLHDIFVSAGYLVKKYDSYGEDNILLP